MERAKSFILAIAMVAIACAMLFDLSRAPRSPYTKANYDRLEVGMTREQVVAILGEPSRVDWYFQDLERAVWCSPIDADGFIAGLFMHPGGRLGSFNSMGELPERPLRIPESMPKLKTASFTKQLTLNNQRMDRRSTLMLDPPKPPTFVPAFP